MTPAAGLRDIFGTRPGVFFVCLFAWTLTNMDQALFGYAVPGILTEFGLPLSAVGIILTISFTVAAGFIVMTGVAADRYGRGLMIGVLLASSALAVAAQGLAAGVMSLTLFRALGFGLSGGLSPATNAIVVENAVPRLRGVTAGLLQCGYPLGWFLAAMLAAPLLETQGWRAVCFVALLVLPCIWPIMAILKRYGVSGPSHHDAAGGPPVRIATLFQPPYRRLSLASMAMFFAFGGAYAGTAFFFPTYFTEARGYTPADAARLVGTSNLVAVVGYIGAALVGEFLLRRRTVFALWCIGGAMMLVGLLWLSDSRTTDLVWYSAMGILFFGSNAVIIVLVAEVFPTAVRATAIAVCGSAPLSMGFAVFPLVVPWLVATLGWSGGLTAVAVPLLLLAAGAALFLPNRASGEAMA